MIWRTIRTNVRQLGFANGLLYMCDRVLRIVSGERARLVRYILVAQPVPAGAGPGVRPSASSTVREVLGTDPVVAQFPRASAVIAARFDAGCQCHVAEVGGRFAGYIWLAFAGYDEDEVRCRYEFASPKESAWDFDVYVHPEFRMGRTFVRLWDAANRELGRRGVRWSFSRISAFNPDSIAAHRRMGLHRLFGATFVYLGSVQLALLGAAPYVHLGWSSGSKPLVRLKVPV